LRAYEGEGEEIYKDIRRTLTVCIEITAKVKVKKSFSRSIPELVSTFV
jgi:hypothetical protein